MNHPTLLFVSRGGGHVHILQAPEHSTLKAASGAVFPPPCRTPLPLSTMMMDSAALLGKLQSAIKGDALSPELVAQFKQVRCQRQFDHPPRKRSC